METLQIKDIYGNVLFKYTHEYNSIARTLSKAVQDNTDLFLAKLSNQDLRCFNFNYSRLHGARLQSSCFDYSNLQGSNLSYADLSNSTFKCANLSHVTLHGANLTNVDLRHTNLTGADLTGIISDKRYVQVTGIGSRKGTTTYFFEDDLIICGCFKGSLSEFENRVKITHDDNIIHLKEYLGIISYINLLK